MYTIKCPSFQELEGFQGGSKRANELWQHKIEECRMLSIDMDGTRDLFYSLASDGRAHTYSKERAEFVRDTLKRFSYIVTWSLKE